MYECKPNESMYSVTGVVPKSICSLETHASALCETALLSLRGARRPDASACIKGVVCSLLVLGFSLTVPKISVYATKKPSRANAVTFWAEKCARDF